jgi:hypothetical protein
MKSVVHFKRTPLAGAPDDLSEAINRHTDWDSRVILTDLELKELPPGTLVHFHNQFAEYDGPQLIQYHSEPENRGCMPPSAFPNAPEYRLVIAQYHATLGEYVGCHVVRNLINFDQPLFDVQPIQNRRIGYSPSTKLRVNKWFDKGYKATVGILQTLQKLLDVEIDIICGRPYAECIQRKSECALLIDECVTGSYHRCTLEGLALGRPTFAWVSDGVHQVVEQAVGSHLPVTNTNMEEMAAKLQDYITQPFSVLETLGAQRRKWMEEHWHPRDVVQDFIQHYERVLE